VQEVEYPGSEEVQELQGVSMTIKSINGTRVYTTTAVYGLLGVNLSIAQIKELGIEPHASSSIATYWSADSVSEIALAFSKKLGRISESLKGKINE
jgi:hypothetical protein